MKRLISICLLLTLILALIPCNVDAASSDSVTMVASSGCYVYSSRSAAASKRAGYVTFGTELEVMELGSTWAEVHYNGKTLYMYSKNLAYKTQTIVKNRVMVSPGAYGCSTSSALGYAFYGTQVSILETVTGKNGKTYLHCIVPEVYDADKTTLLDTDVEGYINTDYLAETCIPKVVTGGTSLYAFAYGSSSSAEQKKAVGTITTGEQVDLLMSNASWAKVRYQGSEYYMFLSKLEPLTLNVRVRRVAQTADARPGSGIVHYVYWNTPIEVLNTYESDTYGTYYYCCIDGDYGFIRQYSSAGLLYMGYNDCMVTTGATKLYSAANASSEVVCSLLPDTAVTVEYASGSWARVSYAGQVGYILLKNLTRETFHASGSYYSSGYRLYKANPSGTIDEEVTLLAKNDGYGYAYVQTQSGACRWIRTASLTSAEELRTCYVNDIQLALYSAPNSGSDVLTVRYMTEIQLGSAVSSGSDGTWYRAYYQDQLYYIWLATGDVKFADQCSSFTYTGSTVYQQDVIDIAMDICDNWNTVYAHQQSDGVMNEDGTYGFDCSGFVSYVLNNAMQEYVPTYKLSANIATLCATEGIYNDGYTGAFSATDVALEELLPGDVLFFSLEEDTDHCGIYLGNGEFVHSTSTWEDSVCVMPLSGIYSENLTGIRRYLPEEVTAAEAEMQVTLGNCGLYAQAGPDAEVLLRFTKGDIVTLLFTNNGNWAYVRTADGTLGYIRVANLAEIE